MSKERAIIKYILTQRKNGWTDAEIRAHMVKWGYATELLNNYFYHADQELMKRQVLTFVVPLVLLLFAGFVLAKSDVTGAVTFSPQKLYEAALSTFKTYSCGDDYPATAKYVKDLSDCVAEETKQNIFCYVNATVAISALGDNDDWYSSNLGIDLSSYSTIDSVALLGRAVVLPYNATADNIDCFSWTHGITRSENWHQCNATESASIAPENLVFYFTDVLEEDGLGVGGLGSELYYNSSYYLCYDELNCTTETSACDENNGYYCVGRLDNEYGSPWYPCDTSLDAPYYRCCKGGCEGIEMECGELIELPDGSVTEFEECRSDKTSGCCSAVTDCVYDSACYSEGEEIEYTYSGVQNITNISSIKKSSLNQTKYTFVCSEAHWCPEGFEYDESLFACAAKQATCYDASDLDYCNYRFGKDDINDWEADTEGTGCIRPDSEGDITIAYNESCIYSGTYGGADFYFYEDITWY